MDGHFAPAGGIVAPRPPRSGAAREALRTKGQFWTPDWVADAMVAWAAAESEVVADPAVGGGALLRAARRLADRRGRPLAILGREIDPCALVDALSQGTDGRDLAQVGIGDFMDWNPSAPLPAIVANPPYLRHQRMSPAYKERLRAMASAATRRRIDARAGLHVFFLIRCLTLLAPGGRLAFLVPADVCEGAFAPALWSWIGERFRVEGAAVFAPAATPFPGINTNAMLLLITNAPPDGSPVSWARVRTAGTPDLALWCGGGLGSWKADGLEAQERPASEALETGLSRPPATVDQDAVALGSLFRVVRGVVSGDNSLFFMTSRRAAELGLPPDCLVRAIGRTGDHAGPVLRVADLDALDRAGRPTHLISAPSLSRDEMPPAIRRLLDRGEAAGVHLRPSLVGRHPWWRMERRDPPPWLFAYLGKRDCRFIRNEAEAVPLTSFLCVYPRDPAMDLDAATAALNDPRTLAALPMVAKSYGDGALKVEPRALERLPVPRAVLSERGLLPPGT